MTTKTCVENINKKNNYHKVNDEIECLICLEHVNVEKEHILCQTCLKYCHSECYDNWKRMKNKKSIKCVHCNQITLLDYRNTTNCFFSRLWGPNYKYLKYT